MRSSLPLCTLQLISTSVSLSVDEHELTSAYPLSAAVQRTGAANQPTDTQRVSNVAAALALTRANAQPSSPQAPDCTLVPAVASMRAVPQLVQPIVVECEPAENLMAQPPVPSTAP